LNNSPRHGEWVDIKSGDRTIKAFVVYPERKDKAPALLVIQEIFGLTDWLRSLCDELAENGVIAVAPDFSMVKSLKMPIARAKPSRP
jgi:carboxymethylenebutenolidase